MASDPPKRLYFDTNILWGWEKYSSGRSFTTPETIAAERANVRRVLEGRNAVEPIMEYTSGASRDVNRSEMVAHPSMPVLEVK